MIRPPDNVHLLLLPVLLPLDAELPKPPGVEVAPCPKGVGQEH